MSFSAHPAFIHNVGRELPSMSIDEPAMGMPVGGTVPGAVTGFPVSTVAGEAVASRLMYESSTPAHVVSQTVVSL